MINFASFNLNGWATESQTSNLGTPSMLSVEKIERPDGYSIAGICNFKVTATLNGLVASGWGSGVGILGEVRAISEAFERLALIVTSGGEFKSKTSSGWAAHVTPCEAVKNAAAELVERDSALNAWFGSGSFMRVPEGIWPSIITSWNLSAPSNLEFRLPEILLSMGPNGACATVLLQSQNGGAVVGHASGENLEGSIESAFFEAVRSAHGVLQFDSISEVISLHSSRTNKRFFGPGANAYAYAYGIPLPKLDIQDSTENEVHDAWSSHVRRLRQLIDSSNFAIYEIGDRFVAQVSATNIMNVFWGPTPTSLNVKNKLPHFVG